MLCSMHDQPSPTQPLLGQSPHARCPHPLRHRGSPVGTTDPHDLAAGRRPLSAGHGHAGRPRPADGPVLETPVSRRGSGWAVGRAAAGTPQADSPLQRSPHPRRDAAASSGPIRGHCVPRHTGAEFVRFLAQATRGYRRREIHVIVDNLSAHKTPDVETWRAKHPRVHLHYTPTYSSWLNQVELWFAKLERDCIARGIFSSTHDLKRKLLAYIDRHNAAAKPFLWTYNNPPKLGEAEVKVITWNMNGNIRAWDYLRRVIGLRVALLQEAPRLDLPTGEAMVFNASTDSRGVPNRQGTAVYAQGIPISRSSVMIAGQRFAVADVGGADGHVILVASLHPDTKKS